MTLLDRLDGLGDEDLRDARLLAWLLDSTAAHGAGLAAANGLASLLAQRGAPSLAQGLASIPPPVCNTSVRLRQGEVEVLLRVADAEVVLAWRSTPVGYEGAIERALADGAVVAGIAPTDGVFPAESGMMAPIILWPDLARALGEVRALDHASLVADLRARLAGPVTIA